MTHPSAPAAKPQLAHIAQQPLRQVQRGACCYTLLGTAHISAHSVAAVEQAINTGRFDQVAVELDLQRWRALHDPSVLADLDLLKVIRQGKVSLFAANLALAAYQRRLASQLGLEPGAELKRAVQLAHEKQLPVIFIDRDVGITFRRAAQRLGWLGRWKLLISFITGLFAADHVSSEEIEKLKHGDMLKASFGDFAQQSPELYQTIITERDQYMAACLRQDGDDRPQNILAVVGAGHLEGLCQQLEQQTAPAQQIRHTLEQFERRRRFPWITIGLLGLIAVGITLGFMRGGFGVGGQLLLIWAEYTATCAALGACLAGSHVFSILLAAIVAPFKFIRLSVPTGAFAAMAELRIRKPGYLDFLSLRDDVQTFKGWYRNRASRILLTFILTNLGNSLGVWIAGARIYKALHPHV